MPEDKSTPPPNPVKRHTPGPWRVGPTHRESEGKSWLFYSHQTHICVSDGPEDIAVVDTGHEDGETNARLFAEAPDHALMLAVVCAGKARWESWDDARGEVACAGLRYATTLDPFGCPVLTDRLRAELRKAVGL